MLCSQWADEEMGREGSHLNLFLPFVTKDEVETYNETVIESWRYRGYWWSYPQNRMGIYIICTRDV